MPIVNAFPATLQNGQLEDATVVMTLLNWLMNQTNGNACPATNGSSILKGNGAGSTAVAVADTDFAAVMPGEIRMVAFASPPANWLACDGSAVNRVTYANLFNAIGTTWGAGDGSTTFNVPDMRGRVPIGAGTGSGLTARTLAATLGEETHALSAGEGPSHNHTVTVSDPGHNHTIADPGHAHSTNGLVPAGGGGSYWGGGTSGLNAVSANANVTGIGIAAATTGITATTVATGSGVAHNNMQPSTVVQYIIKT